MGYEAKITITVELPGGPDEDAARLALASKLRTLADELESGLSTADDAAGGCGLCWYIDQLAATQPTSV